MEKRRACPSVEETRAAVFYVTVTRKQRELTWKRAGYKYINLWGAAIPASVVRKTGKCQQVT